MYKVDYCLQDHQQFVPDMQISRSEEQNGYSVLILIKQKAL